MQLLFRLLTELWNTLRPLHADAATLRRHQERRLRALVHYAYRNSDYYRQRFDAVGLNPATIRGIDDLTRIPLTDKASLKAAPREQLISRDPAIGPLVDERSSGSTGTPFAVAFDRGYLLNRNLRFLRGLWMAGYRWPMKLLLITGARAKPPSRWLRWHYASIKVEAQQSLQTLKSVQPSVLYGCVTPLRELAQLMLRLGESAPQLRSVITTAETLDAPTRELLRRAFRCDVFDFYGMTEMGLVGWECRAHEGYHLALDSVIVEQLPLDDGSGRTQLIYTNLALTGMPLLRYASGDIGFGYTTDRCRCGAHLPRLQRFEGRLVDVIELPDGRRLSPYQFTCELEQIVGLQRYKVIQEQQDHLRITAQVAEERAANISDQIVETVRRITGPEMTIDVELVADMHHKAGDKFRIVENRMNTPTAAAASE